jgi:RNA polymerase sigma-70 factor (ECF subfamily)
MVICSINLWNNLGFRGVVEAADLSARVLARKERPAGPWWLEVERMQEVPEKDAEQTPSEPLPMTTLTLTASLNAPPEKAAKTASGTVPGRESYAETPVEELDDHSLLEATRTGDELAFQEIVKRYRNPITNFVYRMLNDYDRAVDLAQETFVRIYMNVERYQATYSFSTYIYRIASNLAISELRQRKRRRLIPIPTFYSDKENDEFEIDLPDTQQVTAEQNMILDERRDAVSRAIASLPEKYRTVVILRDIEGKSYEEISAVLDLSDGTVKSRINRARGLLKDKLKEYL